MSANDKQHGGDHYKHSNYQHWDFVTDTGQSYLIGCATKYVSRWRKKNGIEDLRKAQHYCEKAAEVRPQKIPYRNDMLWRFLRSNDLTLQEGEIIVLIMEHQWQAAHAAIEKLAQAESTTTEQTGNA